MSEQPKSESEFEKQQQRMRINDLVVASGAPIRHFNFKPEFTGAWGEKVAMLTGKLGTGFMVGVCGIRGNGKTQLGVELIRASCIKERRANYLTSIGFFARLKASYRKDSEESELEIIQDLRKPKLLVIDEIGKRGSSDWENNLLFELVSNRYNDVRDTLLIDNRTKEEFLAGVGPSIASRMLETGGVIEANWESFRK